MTLQQINERCNAGEVCIVDNIEGLHPLTFITRNPNFFINYVVQDDLEKADVVWIFNSAVRGEGK